MCNIIIHRVPSGVKIPSRSCRDMQSLKCTSLLRIFGTNWCVQVKEKERERELKLVYVEMMMLLRCWMLQKSCAYSISQKIV